MKDIRVVHLAISPGAGSPQSIVSALNTHTNVAARLVMYNPNAYGQRTFPGDLVWEKDRGECVSALAAADVVHLHQWFDPGAWFGPEVGALCAKKICVRHFHSLPDVFVGNDPAAIAKVLADPMPQLTMAQYHERYYPRARIVPNIVLLNDPLLAPVKGSIGRPPRIVWSPTFRGSAYASRWATKGYPETLHLLKRISRKVRCTVDVIENTPRDDCLRRRADASLVVDELVTGSFHRSGLEGLSQGKPVLAWLDERTQVVIRELTGASTLPWVNVHLEDAENVLRFLLADPDLREAIGAESRIWMERWYDDRVLIQHYVQAYRDLLERPAIFAQARRDDLAIHWSNVQLPDLIWEARRERAKSNHLLAWQQGVEKNAASSANGSQGDRMGESSGDLERIADQIIISCGAGNVLDISSGEGALVAALLRRGLDAQGIDESDLVVSRCNQRIPGRFTHGSVLSLPFGDESFHTVVSTNCMDLLAPEDVAKALEEIHRVTGRYVFLKIATAQDRDGHGHLPVMDRAWWEARCFEAGFRKHPAYYRINDYESLNRDGRQICVLLEKIPEKALAYYPLASLNEERNLHMDMLRDTGERSDAHVIRYQWACNYIKPGDRVLDAACGLGYGGHLIRHLTQAAEVVGIDGSEYAVEYAVQSFTGHAVRIEYRLGMLPNVLSSFEDASFDVIVSFETLEHMKDSQSLLREFYRLLVPGGRVIVSVPNNWSDETGEDPNPYHLQVYDWTRLMSELSAHFILEEAFAQTASQCKISSQGNILERRPRSLHKVRLAEEAPADCEWWLMVAMKSPLAAKQDYTERVFNNIAQASHPSIRYSKAYHNPWLMHSMVNSGYRLKDDEVLEKLALDVMAISPKNSNDYAAALCVEAYRVLNRCLGDSPAVAEVISQIEAVAANPPEGPTGLRWTVSLLFVKAKLLQMLGHLERAKATFVECASHDVRPFGVHLATKTTEAWFTAGKIAYAIGDHEEAQSCWERGIDSGTILLSVSLDDILINRSFPNRFNHGDGVREYMVSWDNIACCANGLNLLKQGRPLDYSALENCFQTEYSVVTRDLIECRLQLVSLTKDLVETRQTLSERTVLLEQANKDLVERTRELVETRHILVERTERLEQANKDLVERTRDLVETRQTLSERTVLLEQANKDLVERTQELVETRHILVERTERLEQASKDLVERTERLER